MLEKIRGHFSAKLILLISLVFIIPVATSLVTLVVTSRASLARFDLVLKGEQAGKSGLIKEIFPRVPAEEIPEPGQLLKLLREYEHRRTFGLFMSLIVISVALAGVVVLLSMLILKRGLLTLHELSLAADRIGEGDFSVALEPHSRDEFADLVGAFRTMARRLDETTVSRDFYNHAIESMPAAVVTVDNGGIVTTWNRHAAELTGLSSAETLGKSFTDFSDVIVSASNAPQIPFFSRESVVRTRAGRQLVVSKGADHLYDRQGAKAGMIETFVDISGQKEMERQLVIARDRAEESSRLRSEFLANMSHEIRTPLNGILGLAELLEEDEPDTERRSNLATIKQCGQNLLHLINEILQLSKLEAGRMLLQPAVVATADVVREATATVEVGCRRKGIDLNVAIDEAVPPVIEIDNHKLVQILVNLLGNALKFTEKGFIKVGVSQYRGEFPGNIIFTVADSGIGIPADRLNYIFESFVQAEGYLTRSGDGTGLGLTIARKLVHLMGGHMAVESEPGKGSVFSFTIDSRTGGR
ncbi:MAG: ATP-binding protein [Pseudomonadota bacterium]